MVYAAGHVVADASTRPCRCSAKAATEIHDTCTQLGPNETSFIKVRVGSDSACGPYLVCRPCPRTPVSLLTLPSSNLTLFLPTSIVAAGDNVLHDNPTPTTFCSFDNIQKQFHLLQGLLPNLTNTWLAPME